ncbi:MAG TPA: hypothetical protein VH639_12970 [Bryobacteraceae bacterium]|jgi:hypothetical protein
MLPAISGQPIRVEMRRSLGRFLAAASIPRRIILLDAEVLYARGDFERILVHELFHFVWARLSNALRRDWELLLSNEFAAGAEGELGWSSEWRKTKLGRLDRRRRTMRWRRYTSESFCDTAAWRFAGLRTHGEFTLGSPFRRIRREWFECNMESGDLRI